jgi:hypothetical protein
MTNGPGPTWPGKPVDGQYVVGLVAGNLVIPVP